jgi:ribokinase
MPTADSAAPLVVLGSANMDLVYAVATIPAPGQTVLATGSARHAGGKGLNQAVAGARAGLRTAFVGALGDDADGRVLRTVLRDAGIETGGVTVVEAPTGTALITVQDDGENAIVVAAGANGKLTELDSGQRAAVEGARVLVAQQEVPPEVVLEAARLAAAANTRFVLNAAPARTPDAGLLDLVDVLVVNESEALLMAGGQDPLDAARRLAQQVRVVVVTLGADGCAVVGAGEQVEHIAATASQVVDTTGAGDTFTGVLAAAMAEGADVVTAARRASVAAGISVERHGAVPSIPTRAEIDARQETP